MKRVKCEVCGLYTEESIETHMQIHNWNNHAPMGKQVGKDLFPPIWSFDLTGYSNKIALLDIKDLIERINSESDS